MALSFRPLALLLVAVWATAPTSMAAKISVDASAYPKASRVAVEETAAVGDSASRLSIRWPTGDEQQQARCVINLAGDKPLIESLGLSAAGGEFETLLTDVDPVVYVTVGSRRVPGGKPDDQKWQVFFDKPANRPHDTFVSKLDLQRVTVAGNEQRASITIDKLSAGEFHGSLQLNFYADCRLLHIEALLETDEDGRAILYDAGLVGDTAPWKTIAWMDSQRRMQGATINQGNRPAEQTPKSRHRTILAEFTHGSIACFSPPHQFHFPRDWSDNFGYVWYGAGHRGVDKRFGFGVQQDKAGGRAFVPWFNAPPGVPHRMGVFYLLSDGNAEQALQQTLRYTHGDRFPELPGYLTMTSHYHMAISEAALQRKQRGQPEITPDFVNVFKDMNVNMVHLGEFHGDGHQKDEGPLRLPEMQTMFHECRRLSDEKLLLIPGEEVNAFLGLPEPGKHPGHWMSLFPKPVYWTMKPDDPRPFVEETEQYGRVYHVGDRGDMVRLIKEEDGLVWAAHPRIKASSWTPDIFRNEDFFLADYWLGGAWKAMPADLSEDRLGIRVLDLLDDMANWGHKKYVLGEVDVFKIDGTHELYAHMNINYLKMDRLPKFDEGWRPVMDVLRDGKFFVSTGEVLIPDFKVNGRESGDRPKLDEDGGARIEARVSWTFPPAFLLLVSGDGEHVHQEKIDLGEESAFRETRFNFSRNLRGRRWLRLEVWDVAGNGAFTQPVWLE
ncbi:MAG: hypothetical protein RIC55_15220 [Pirellulaceae bacterium]